MTIAYGHDATQDDPFIELVDQVALRFMRAIKPGEFLVDIIPIRKFLF